MFFQGLANESSARTGIIYLAEGVVGIILAITLLHFSKIYHREYLRTWSISWAAFFVGSLGLSFSIFYGVSRMDNIRFVSTLVSQTGTYLHVALLLMGTYELVKQRKVTALNLLVFTGVVILVSLILSLLYNQSSGAEAIQYRYFFRVVIRHFIVTLGFMIIVVMIFRNTAFTRGLGQRILIGSFFSYSLVYLYYFIIGMGNVLGYDFSLPFFFGMVEMVLISLMGMSTVMWLLEDERERLNEINKELDSFLYSTSHDLRSPIASVLGLANLAKLEITDPKSLSYMEMIEGRVRKLDSVISDILLMSRSKKVEIKKGEINFTTLLKEVLTDLKFNEGANAIALEFTPSDQYVFVSDYNQVKIIMVNLIMNAIKYHNLKQSHPYIKVNFTTSDKNVIISVEDNGQGIAKEFHLKIFEMFYRANATADGTGLGLYIVKMALEKIKGTISVDSTYGKGSIFTLSLPKN